MGVDKFIVYIILLLSFVVEVLNVFLFVEVEVKINEGIFGILIIKFDNSVIYIIDLLIFVKYFEFKFVSRGNVLIRYIINVNLDNLLRYFDDRVC